MKNLLNLAMKQFALLALTLLSLPCTTLLAETGDPVAIRAWPGGAMTIETMWNFHIAIGLTEADRMLLPRSPDLELHDDDQQWKFDGMRTKLHVFADYPGQSWVLDRLPNEKNASWQQQLESADCSGNAVVCRSIPIEAGNDETFATEIKVDGVTIVYCPKEAVRGLKQMGEDYRRRFDVLFIADPDFDWEAVHEIALDLEPGKILVRRWLVPLEKLRQTPDFKPHLAFNTCTVSVSDDEFRGSTIRTITDETFEPSAELEDLIAKKEFSSDDCQDVFKPLTVEQMNFRPPNGTHTPRWNVEHMMGRELLFVSQIYHAIDPSIPIMDLNPAQMPDDYEFAHEDWTGEEEARQIERVAAFTKRFAYLLDGIELKKKAPGSKHWSVWSLMKQMERHYDEHTANVKKKMELPEWPE